MRDAVIAFVVLAAVMLAGPLLFRRGRRGSSARHAARTGGTLVLRPPRKNAVLLGITALFPAALLGAVTFRAWTLGRAGPAGVLAGALATALVVAFAAYAFTSAFRTHVVVRDTGIERVGVFSRRVLGWGTITKVAFNPAQHWFFVTASDGSHLWLPADLPGMPEFAQLARRRLHPAALRADPVAREVLDELAEADGDEA